VTDDDRTHLLFSLLDGLRLVIPPFSRDPSATDQPRSLLIPGVYYVFYTLPESVTAKPPVSSPAKAAPVDQRRAVSPHRPRAAKPVTATKPRIKADTEPLEGLYDRRQVKRKEEVIKDRRQVLNVQPRPAAKAFPICYIGDVTYILNPNSDIIIGLLRSAKLVQPAAL